MNETVRKVLIVDDEKRIGELIRSLIHWEELDLTCVGLCTDGESAWEMIRENCPGSPYGLVSVHLPAHNPDLRPPGASHPGKRCSLFPALPAWSGSFPAGRYIHLPRDSGL